jgi:hypothetical protein
MPTSRYAVASSDRSEKRSISLALVFLAIVAAGGAFTWLQSRNIAQPTTITLQMLSGEATLKRADAGGGPPLQAGERSTLQRGDEVRTGTAAKGRLTFTGGDTSDLDSETRLTILESYQAPMSRALVAILALDEGKALTRLRASASQDGKYELQTPVATFQTHGAIFECDALGKNRAYLAVFDGQVMVTMGEQSLEVKAGQALDVRLGQPLSPVAVSQTPPPDIGPLSTVVPKSIPSAPMVGVTASPGSLAAPGATATYTNREKTLFPPAVTPTRPGDNLQYYTAKQGDTLASIARQYGVSWETILAANKDVLSKPEALRPGQRLRIPKP